jgi:hypothetical protein
LRPGKKVEVIMKRPHHSIKYVMARAAPDITPIIKNIIAGKPYIALTRAHTAMKTNVITANRIISGNLRKFKAHRLIYRTINGRILLEEGQKHNVVSLFKQKKSRESLPAKNETIVTSFRSATSY